MPFELIPPFKDTDDDRKASLVDAARRAEAKLASIAKTRRPTDAETEEARRAYAAAAWATRRDTFKRCTNCQRSYTWGQWKALPEVPSTVDTTFEENGERMRTVYKNCACNGTMAIEERA